MEPLQVLLDMIEDRTYDTIAGPPQIVKIYSHVNVLPINVLWPIRKPKYISHFGRPLLGYESSKFACLDLRDFELLSHPSAFARLNTVEPRLEVQHEGLFSLYG